MGVLSKAEGDALVEIARAAIEKTDEPTSETEKTIGLFITLKVDDQILGCMGDPYPTKPLNQLVKQCAIAAFEDSRYPQLDQNQLDRLVIELSVLTTPRPIRSDEIEVGRHGLIIGNGLILPQIAKEGGWDVPTFLENVCKKAGLFKDAWKDKTKLLGFEVQTFKTETRAACHSQ